MHNKKMLVIYISSAYTLGDIAENVRAQLDASDTLIELGFCPIAPLLSHYQQIYKPRSWYEWMDVDMELVSRCDALLRLPGKSTGADTEVSLAKKLKIPVYYDIGHMKSDTICGKIKRRIYKS